MGSENKRLSGQTETLHQPDAEGLRALDQAVARGWTHLPEVWGGEQVVTEEAEPRASMSTPQGQLSPGGNTGQSNYSLVPAWALQCRSCTCLSPGS